MYLRHYDVTSKALYTKPLPCDTGIPCVTATFAGVPFQTSKVNEDGDLEFRTTNGWVDNSFEKASH